MPNEMLTPRNVLCCVSDGVRIGVVGVCYIRTIRIERERARMLRVWIVFESFSESCAVDVATSPRVLDLMLRTGRTVGGLAYCVRRV